MMDRGVLRLAEERQIVEHLRQRGSAASVSEIALELGWSWQRVSKIVKRMLAGYELGTVTKEHKDWGYRIRVVTRYHPARPVESLLPAWMGQTVYPVVQGRPIVFSEHERPSQGPKPRS